MLLIISNTRDLGADYFVHRLRQRSRPFVRINTDEYPRDIEIALLLSEKGVDVRISRLTQQCLRLGDISGVYFRRPVSPAPNASIDDADRSFVQREHLEVLRSLWRLIPEELWINHPTRLWMARNKCEQLHRAMRLGFRIPRTIIASDPQEIRDETSAWDTELIAKVVKHAFDIREGCARLAVTRLLTPHELERMDQYARSPMIVQERIPKVFDLRITVVGGRVFAAEIESQHCEATATDWRAVHLLDGVDLKHNRHSLPDEIDQRCVELTRSYGLRFSAIDMVLTPEGHYVFLEINPNGEWVWIEERLKYPIADALIDILVGATNERS